jgi:hypothetical protein
MSSSLSYLWIVPYRSKQSFVSVRACQSQKMLHSHIRYTRVSHKRTYDHNLSDITYFRARTAAQCTRGQHDVELSQSRGQLVDRLASYVHNCLGQSKYNGEKVECRQDAHT